MRKSALLCAGTILLLLPAESRAQLPQPFDGRVTVSVNAGGQAGSTDVSRQRAFSLYEEEARFESNQTVSTGGILDIGGTYRVGANWGVGIGYTRSQGSNDAVVAGSIPHPLFFGQPRTVNASLTGLSTRERAVHLQAVLFVPFVERVDFAFAAGPSFYSVRQEFATGFAISEVPPGFNTVSIDSIDLTTARRSGTGFNLSGEATYAVTNTIGAGLMLRYTRANVEFGFGDGGTVELSPGGLQIAAGVRLRF